MTPTNTTTYTVTAEQYGEIEAGVAKLAAKAVALGMTGSDVPGTRVVATIPAMVYMKDCGRTRTMPASHPAPKNYTAMQVTTLIRFEVIGSTPRMAGWEFVATLEVVKVVDGGTEVQVRRMPSADPLPAGFAIGDGTACDHCGKKRARRLTLVVRNDDGRLMRVGKQCLKDFLGHSHPEDVLFQVLGIGQLLDGHGDSDSFDGGGSTRRYFTPTVFIEVAEAVIRVTGFVSKAKAVGGAIATADRVQSVLTALVSPNLGNALIRETYRVTEQDRDNATQSLAWARALMTGTEFVRGLGLAARMVEATPQTFGFLAYLPVAYARHLEGVAAARDEANGKGLAPSSYQGTVGEKLTRTVTVKMSQSYDSHYGVTHLHVMTDTAGNEYTWWASSERQTAGSTATVTMTVKKHETKKVAQTVVLRVKPVKGTEWVMQCAS